MLLSSSISVTIEHVSGRVSHSRRRVHNRREIDILLEIEGRHERTALLIENKLDTSPQPNQAESYREEAQLLTVNGEFTRAVTVLVCPASYAAKLPGFAGVFDCILSYEEIRKILSDRALVEAGELRERLSYRADLLTQAIDKSRRRYEQVPLAAVTNFTKRYVDHLAKNDGFLPPGPSMLKDSPGESKTMIFAADALPKWGFLPQTRLVHQLREGNANICLYGWGDYFSYLAGDMAPALKDTGYRLVPTANKRANGKSGLMIVAPTPTIDNLSDFDAQLEQIDTGIQVVTALADWFWKQEAEVQKWAELVTSLKTRNAAS